jgi:2'-5' RNA ligase
VTDGSARLFVALELPADVVSALVSWRSRALGGMPGVRLLEPSSLHVTLCFLGLLPLSAVGQVGEACARAAAGHAEAGRSEAGRSEAGRSDASGLSLSDIVWLPRRRPSVVAVRVDDPLGTLASLQAAVAGALVEGGWYAPEARAFLAHVTVARAARGARLRAPASVPSPPAVSFSGSRVTLFRSHPGSVYEPLRSVPPHR